MRSSMRKTALSKRSLRTTKTRPARKRKLLPREAHRSRLTASQKGLTSLTPLKALHRRISLALRSSQRGSLWETLPRSKQRNLQSYLPTSSPSRNLPVMNRQRKRR